MPLLNGQSYAVEHINVSATSDGDNVVIAGVANKNISVLGYVITSSATGVVTFQDTNNTDLAVLDIAIQGGVSYAGGIDCPAFETPTGLGLEISVQASQDVRGHLTYQIVS
jgi:hypothetical protein